MITLKISSSLDLRGPVPDIFSETVRVIIFAFILVQKKVGVSPSFSILTFNFQVENNIFQKVIQLVQYFLTQGSITYS